MRPGEEALGLTAGLLASAVRSVVAAVAPVARRGGRTRHAAYHRALAGGADSAAALERASAGQPTAGCSAPTGPTGAPAGAGAVR